MTMRPKDVDAFQFWLDKRNGQDVTMSLKKLQQTDTEAYEAAIAFIRDNVGDAEADDFISRLERNRQRKNGQQTRQTLQDQWMDALSKRMNSPLRQCTWEKYLPQKDTGGWTYLCIQNHGVPTKFKILCRFTSCKSQRIRICTYALAKIISDDEFVKFIPTWMWSGRVSVSTQS